MGLQSSAASGSTSESTGEEFEVSRSSKGLPSSDPQSCGEGQAVQSVRDFPDEDILMEPIGSMGEERLNMPIW
jgi:hypothetical protein